MDQKFPEDEESLLTEGEASLKTGHASVKDNQCVNHGKSVGCNHNCGEQDITNYSCDFCDKSFECKSFLQTHITTVHQTSRNFPVIRVINHLGIKAPLRLTSPLYIETSRNFPVNRVINHLG